LWRRMTCLKAEARLCHHFLLPCCSLRPADLGTPLQLASEYMAELSQSRVDLSGVPLWKRLILIALWFMLGSSIAIVIGLQFVWVAGVICTPVVDFGYWGDRDGLGAGIIPDLQKRWLCRFHCRRYESKRFPIEVIRKPQYRFVSGVYCSISVTYGLSFGLHHVWLISLTAAMYIFARWRIRRSAILKNPPA